MTKKINIPKDKNDLVGWLRTSLNGHIFFVDQLEGMDEEKQFILILAIVMELQKLCNEIIPKLQSLMDAKAQTN